MDRKGAHDDVLVEHHGRYVVLRLNRPERMNALATTTTARLLALFDALARDNEVWAIMIAGSGDRAFCAGVDLKEANDMAVAGKSFPRPMAGIERNLFEAVLECPKPTIAAINGVALGGGLELALACDIRLMRSDTRVGFPEARRGMGAHFASVLLPRLVARGVAFDLLYTARMIDADEAYRIGLVSSVWPPLEFDREAHAYAAGVVGNAPLTLQRYKQMALQGTGMPIAAALRLDVRPDPYSSDDREEGVRAFLEKRPPLWKGR